LPDNGPDKDSIENKMPFIIPPLAEWWVYWNTLVRPSVRPSVCP
jgi:hypothetical protein